MDEVRVEKLVVRINGISIELTIEEAKKLQESLNQLFGSEKEIVIQKEYWPYWVEKPITYPWATYTFPNSPFDNSNPIVYLCASDMVKDGIIQ